MTRAVPSRSEKGRQFVDANSDGLILSIIDYGVQSIAIAGRLTSSGLALVTRLTLPFKGSEEGDNNGVTWIYPGSNHRT